MKKTMKELQKIKGIGEILTKRFIKAGYNSFEAIVAAGEEGLKKIKGVNPQVIPSILEQATALAAECSAERARKVAEIKAAAAAIRDQVEGISQGNKRAARRGVAGKDRQ